MLTLHNKDEIVMSAQADDVIDKEKGTTWSITFSR